MVQQEEYTGRTSITRLTDALRRSLAERQAERDRSVSTCWSSLEKIAKAARSPRAVADAKWGQIAPLRTRGLPQRHGSNAFCELPRRPAGLDKRVNPEWTGVKRRPWHLQRIAIG